MFILSTFFKSLSELTSIASISLDFFGTSSIILVITLRKEFFQRNLADQGFFQVS